MCYSLWYNTPTMLLAGHRSATSWVHYTTSCNTQSSAPEDGLDQRPKHVELIGIINKQLSLRLVGFLYYLHSSVFSMEVTGIFFSEKLLIVYWTTWCYFPEFNLLCNYSNVKKLTK